jgi:hypothetical protein
MQMRLKIVLLIFLYSVLICNFTVAQNEPAQKTRSKVDSTNLLETIEAVSGRNKLGRFIYRITVKPFAPKSNKRKVKNKVYRKLIHEPYSAFEGKIIRHITIKTLDPFGYTVADTNEVTPYSFSRTRNALHAKSRISNIRNLLLIYQNQLFDSLLVKESERLVRSQNYVREVMFLTKAASVTSDSVDIYIRELDIWSIIIKSSFSNIRSTIQLTDNNLLGFGHEFSNSYTWYPEGRKSAFNTNYFIPNIHNTFINTTLHYGKDEFGIFNKSIAIERTFISPFTKWAGGVKFGQQSSNDSLQINNSLFMQQSYKFNTQDFWGGYAMTIFKGNSENSRSTKLISTLRYLRVRYLEKPFEEINIQQKYSNEEFYITGIGISTRKYVQEKYIFNYGVTEDVPIGKVFGVTGGYQKRNSGGRFYVGARISYGNYFPWGYISSNCEYGTFLKGSMAQQGIISAGIIYFTGLFEVGKWKFRQFVKPQITYGINRFASDSLTLNDGYGLDGFKSSELTGTKRILITLQTQSYTPWNFIGFRFGPFITYSVGMLADDVKGFKSSKVYSQIGLGVLIKNVNMVINTFQLSIAFYPLIPGNGHDVFKINSLRTSDFGFRDFSVGKPETAVYQ